MRTLYTHFRENSVYPGHPITVALEIMLAYERDLDKAFAPSIRKDGTHYGWCDAVGNSAISGAGGNVYLGVDLLKHIKEGNMTLSQAIEWGMKTWERQSGTAGDQEKFQKGQEQAERMVWPLLDQVYRAMSEGKL